MVVLNKSWLDIETDNLGGVLLREPAPPGSNIEHRGKIPKPCPVEIPAEQEFPLLHLVVCVEDIRSVGSRPLGGQRPGSYQGSCCPSADFSKR